ncbi:hypothetical protein niasHS_018047 [Heterodera schachtii]|uniref:Potassium channel domain-containing protein n=1 Tax=Heterodera schachtii TaxID=97005 RepID=A0ABD2HQ16_HETSC
MAPVKLAAEGAEISFIDEDKEEEEDGDEHGQQEEPSSSNTTPGYKNGMILPFPSRRTVSLMAPLPSQILTNPAVGGASRKKAMFKISLVTVDDDDDRMGYCTNSKNRPKRSWLPLPEQQHENHKKFGSSRHKKATVVMSQRHHFLALAQPKKRTTKIAKHWSCPYKIWRDKFLREHNCRREELCKEVFLSALPHFGVLFVVSAYIFLGSLAFRQLDTQMAKLPFHDVLLFAFTTITTIGYGNIVPRTPFARVACVVYCLAGIPLVFLPLSNLGELLAEFYWVGIASLKGQKENADADDQLHPDGPCRLPLKVVVLLILFHSLLGGLIFHFWIQKMPIFPAIYFSFISITTIGFGDLCPEPQNLCETLVIIVYLSCGIAIMSTLFNTLGDHLRCIHYLGRDFEGAPDVRVWFGGQPLTVRELVALVANRFEIAPERLREVLAELDALIRHSDYGTATTQISTTASARHSRENDDDNDLRPSRSANNDQNHELLQQQSYSPTSSITSEQQQMIQALSTLHRLTIKGTRTFHTPSTNSLSLLIRSASSANNHQNQIQ